MGVGARRADPVPARPAPRPQHRLQDGRAARRDGRVGSRTRSWGGLDAGRGRSARASSCGRGTARCTRASPCAQIERCARSIPGIRVIVHPEVPWDVVQAADEQRLDRVHHQAGDATARPGPSGPSAPRSTSSTGWRDEVAPERPSSSLDQFGCLCSTMFRVSPNHLLWVLEGLVDGEVHNRIVVPDEQKHWAQVALDRMLQSSQRACSSTTRAWQLRSRRASATSS